MKTKIKYILVLFSIILIYLSCSEKKDPFSVTTHPEGWDNESSSLFHGAVLLENNLNMEDCQSCHGIDYLGGTSGASCAESGCHDTPGGPEACNTCHGNDINAAPPKDIYGNTDSSMVGVGAHQVHLMETTWTTAYQKDCNLCHITPSSFSSPGHIDDYPFQAEINFSSIVSNNTIDDPMWNHNSATCDNVYCHGGFAFDSLSAGINSWAYTTSKIKGNNLQWEWTSNAPGYGNCASCHDLPPKGHIAAQSTDCVNCHSKVVDANLNIINKNLHINGKKDLN